MFNRAPRTFSRSFWYLTTAGAVAGIMITPLEGAPSSPHAKSFKVAGYTFIVPAGSSMQRWCVLSNPGVSGAEFQGKFLLTGTLYYKGPQPHGYDSGSDPASFSIAPDKASLAHLPYWKDDGAAQASFDTRLNSDTQTAILPASLRRMVDASKGRKVAGGSVSLHVDSYTVFVDGCGVSEYSIEGESINHAGPMQLMTAPPEIAKWGEDC